MERVLSSLRGLGRDAALWLGRKHGRLTLKQLGELCGGVDYAQCAGGVTVWRTPAAATRTAPNSDSAGE